MRRTLVLALSLTALVVLLAVESTAGALPLAASTAHAVPLADPAEAPAWPAALAVPLAGLGAPALPAGPASPASLQWYNGANQYSYVTNCASMIFGSPYTEANVGTFVGFAADPVAGTPRPNDVYYLHVYFAGLGNPCTGTRVYLDIQLPANTALAIDSTTNKLRCFSQPPNGGWSEFTNTADCGQSPSNAFNPYNPGAYQILSTDSAHGNTWPLPQGGAYEFQIPVRSSTPLTASALQANLWTLDGNSSPWLRPQVGVYVFSTSGAGTPSFTFDSPSYLTLTSTYAYSYGYLFFSGPNPGGNFYGELWDASLSTRLVNDGPATVPNTGYAFKLWDDWTPFLLRRIPRTSGDSTSSEAAAARSSSGRGWTC